MIDLNELKAPVTEIYVDTVQGEGQSIGKLCSFIRYTGCNRSCNFCDSRHTWKPGEIQTSKWSVRAQIDFLMQGQARRLIITGGEPLLHQDKPYFQELIKQLSNKGWSFEIETEGTNAPNAFLCNAVHVGLLQFNVSPKLKLAGMGDLSEEYARVLPTWKSATSLSQFFLNRAIFKFVVNVEEDVQEAFALLKKAIPNHNEDLVRNQIYLMPEGETREKQLEKLSIVLDLAIKYGVNFSPRLHVLRWDNKKAV
jgi:7-carboxy-7-deazaguanine synthase